jgi:aryl carrier-like protein
MFSTKSFAKKGVAEKIKKRKFYAYSFVEIVENPTLNLWKK